MKLSLTGNCTLADKYEEQWRIAKNDESGKVTSHIDKKIMLSNIILSLFFIKKESTIVSKDPYLLLSISVVFNKEKVKRQNYFQQRCDITDFNNNNNNDNIKLQNTDLILPTYLYKISVIDDNNPKRKLLQCICMLNYIYQNDEKTFTRNMNKTHSYIHKLFVKLKKWKQLKDKFIDMHSISINLYKGKNDNQIFQLKINEYIFKGILYYNNKINFSLMPWNNNSFGNICFPVNVSDYNSPHKVTYEEQMTPEKRSLKQELNNNNNNNNNNEEKEKETRKNKRKDTNNNNNNNNFLSFKQIPLSCVLLPYCLVLLSVAILSLTTPYYVSINNVYESLEDMHNYNRLELNSRLVNILDTPKILSNVLLNLYIKNETYVQKNNEKIPMDFNMTQRLCGIIRQMESIQKLKFIYIASVSRDEIAFCLRGYHSKYLATLHRRRRDHKITHFLAIDPVTTNLISPPLVLKKIITPYYLKELVYNFTKTGKRLDIWKKEIIKGKNPKLKLWNIEHFPFTRYAYTQPFLEKEGTVSFIKIAIDINPNDIFFTKHNHSQILTNIIVLDDTNNKIYNNNNNNDDSSDNDDDDDMGNMTIIASDWIEECKTEFGTSTYSLDDTNQKVYCNNINYKNNKSTIVKQRKLNNITNPLIEAVFKHIDKKYVLNKVRRGETFYIQFPYKKSFATFSLAMLDQGLDAPIMIAIVIYPLFLNSFASINIHILIILTFITAGATVLIFYIFTVCISHPLLNVAAELRMAANAETQNHNILCTYKEKKIRTSFLTEVAKLQKVCRSLNAQLAHLRSFVPQGLSQVKHLTENTNYSHSSNDLVKNQLKHGDIKDNIAREGLTKRQNFVRSTDTSFRGNMFIDFRDNINVFTDFVCSIVSVHIIGIEDIVEYVGQIANIVMEAAKHYEGTTDVFLPEMFHVNFPCRDLTQSNKMNATLCALEIYKNLPNIVCSHCTILVDSGVFHFGVCGGPEKKELALWGRAMGLELIHLQRSFGIPLAIVQSIIPSIRSRFFILPFVLVHVDVLEKSLEVILYTIVDDFYNTAMWNIVEETYCKGFNYLMLRAYSEANVCFENLIHSSHVTPQLLRLLHRQMAQVQQCNKALYHTSSVEQHIYDPEYIDIVTSGWSIGSHSRTEKTPPETLIVTYDSPSTLELQTHIVHSCSANCLRHVSCYRGLVEEFLDKNNVKWTRATKDITDHSRYPFFLGINDTGTLATLKFMPLTSLLEDGFFSLDEIERSWTYAQSLYHENIVQTLGYARMKEYMCLIMEYVPGGSLRESVSRYGRALPLMAVKRFLVSALRALEYLHSLELVHGNVRPECVMMAVEGLYKLQCISTFCTAKAAAVMTTEEMRARHGHSGWAYSSPEIFTTGKCSPASDIYAVGVVLLELITNKTPWRWTEEVPTTQTSHSLQKCEKNTHQHHTNKISLELFTILSDFDFMREALAEGKIALIDIPSEGDPLLQEVLYSCLAEDPKGRKTASELLQLLCQMP